jgi:hypothetical protein
MNAPRRATLSLAGFVLICFFLPWVQLSCVGMRDSLSGYDLAREGDKLLWVVPLLMVAILITGLVRSIWEKVPSLFALASTVGGSISAYVMYYERSTTNDSPRLIATRWTPFYWLGLTASLGIIAVALLFYSRRSRSS